MLIKINTDDLLDSKLEHLKFCFDVGSASKAVANAAIHFADKSSALSDALDKIEDLEDELEELKRSVNEYHNSKEVMLTLANN